ncbi:MAG: phosphoribosylglycinamide formyltransferase [Balneolaceae bacterium]|nr:phosphoribosylglycinamide formyltransferase [Balneolaceae bacterium]MDR9446694.1 phosphoribosylglycinamide formyltransferase [Balneolaceae bacterium]
MMGKEVQAKSPTPRFVAFASGSGSNFESIMNAIERGELHATCVGLIASRPHIGAIDKALARDIPVHILSQEDSRHSDLLTSDLPTSTDEELINVVESMRPHFGVLAGYLKKLPATLLDILSGPVFNIHPSLLPKFGGKGFYGLRVHKAVLEAGETESGCTVHLVTDQYDEGPILAQARLSIPAKCTPEELAEAVLTLEHSLYPITIQTTLEDYGTLQPTFATTH